MRNLPARVKTDCPRLNQAWKAFAESILHEAGVPIADEEEELNWHAFLGHSLDMQGFRAAEFAGADPLSKALAPEQEPFTSLRQRNIGVRQLGQLWQVEPIREHLISIPRGTPLASTYEVLQTHGGEAGRSLAEALGAFPYRKGHWTVRALLSNSARLREYGYSFRHWLLVQCRNLGVNGFPPGDFRLRVRHPYESSEVPLEEALCDVLKRTFYYVGPQMAPYMLCDWQLWLWREGATGLFEGFKRDLFHERFTEEYGVAEMMKTNFVQWWHSQTGCESLPPRLANECIWLAVERGLVSEDPSADVKSDG